MKNIFRLIGFGLILSACAFLQGCKDHSEVITRATEQLSKRNYESALATILEVSDGDIVESDTLSYLLASAYYGETLKPARDISNECYDLEFTPDRGTVIFNDYQTGTLSFYSYPDMNPTRNLLLPSAAFNIALSPDGSLLAAATKDKKILIYDYVSGNQISEITAHSSAVRDVVFRNNDTLYSCGNDQRVRAWNLKSDKPDWEKHLHSRNIKNISISKDHNRLITASNDGMASIVSLSANNPGREEGKLVCSENYVNGAAISPDNKYAVTACGDGHLQTWTLDTNDMIHDIVINDHLGGVAISPDGKHIITGGEKNAYVIDAEEGKLIAMLPGRNMPIWAVTFIDNNHFAYADNSSFWHGELLDRKALISEAGKLNKK